MGDREKRLGVETVGRRENRKNKRRRLEKERGGIET